MIEKRYQMSRVIQEDGLLIELQGGKKKRFPHPRVIRFR